jgi:uncharacterized protein (TIGR02391 family)
VITADPSVIVDLPVDQLGIEVLNDLIASNAWNEYNYLLEARETFRANPGAAEAIAEAFAWIRARAFIARKPGDSGDATFIVTRTGRRVAKEGFAYYAATEKLQGGLHPTIEREARPQFLIGKYELGVFAAMRAVEVRVRDLASLGASEVGVDLMNHAFGPGGALRDPGTPKGEQDGMRALFAGAYAVLRNPAGHRPVNYDEIQEATEAVHTASMLMRVLDRIDRRLGTKPMTARRSL